MKDAGLGGRRLFEDVIQLVPHRVEVASRRIDCWLGTGKAHSEDVRCWWDAKYVAPLGDALGLVGVGASEVEDAMNSLVLITVAVEAQQCTCFWEVDVVYERRHKNFVHLGQPEGSW